MPSTSYAPNESAQEIFSEHTWLQGALLAAVAYGMQFILFLMSCYLLFKHRNRSNSRMNIALIVYISIIFILGTLYIAALLQFTQQSFIDGRNIPGGPNAYEDIMYSIPIDMLGNVTMVMVTWMCDIINVWRCLVIYKGSTIPLWIIGALPAMMYLASIMLGILWLKQVDVVSQSPWATQGVNFTIPYYTMSLALNILVTILIVLRLLYCRNRINQSMGKTHGAQYTSLSAMVIESAAIYSTFSLLFLVPFTIGSPLSQLFLQALSPVQNVSTFLIIFRVAQGKGWTDEAINVALTNTIGSNHRTPIRIHATKSTFSDARHNEEAISLPQMKMASISTGNAEFNETMKSNALSEAI